MIFTAREKLHCNTKDLRGIPSTAVLIRVSRRSSQRLQNSSRGYVVELKAVGS